MGVLDEAIKHHLELKRRHGADPSEVAELELEALGEGLDAAQPLPQPRPRLREDAHLSQLEGEDDGLDQLRAEFSRAGTPRNDQAPHLHEETMEIDIPSLFGEVAEDQGQSVAFRY